MFQNLFVGVSLGGHYSSANLTEAYTVAPSTAIKSDYIVPNVADIKGRALQVRIR